MRIILFGASGFIGKRVQYLLNVNNADYTSISRTVSGLHYQYADITKPETLERIEGEFDAAIICSSVLPRQSYNLNDLSEYVVSNVIGVNNILIWAKSRRIRKIIYCSSLSIVPAYSSDENDLIDVSSHYIYKVSKASAEHFLIGFCKQEQIEYVCLRISSVYGFGMKKDVILTLIDKITLGEKITIHNVNRRSDFIHVSDVAKAIVGSLSSSISNEIINVASGYQIGIEELVKLLSSLMNKPMPALEIQSDLPVANKVYSTVKIKKLIGSQLDLKVGLMELIQ